MKDMKKVITLATIALIGLSSCKKDRTCVCVDSDDGYTEAITLKNLKKKDAKTICESNNQIYNSYQTICELK